VGEDRSQTGRRVSVPDAARLLGISVEAVRGRIKRGTLEHEKEEDGAVYVLLDADRSQPVADQSTDQTALELMREMMELTQERLRYLERQVEEERGEEAGRHALGTARAAHPRARDAGRNTAGGAARIALRGHRAAG
jgi:hypothetical protein